MIRLQKPRAIKLNKVGKGSERLGFKANHILTFQFNVGTPHPVRACRGNGGGDGERPSDEHAIRPHAYLKIQRNVIDVVCVRHSGVDVTWQIGSGLCKIRFLCSKTEHEVQCVETQAPGGG